MFFDDTAVNTRRSNWNDTPRREPVRPGRPAGPSPRRERASLGVQFGLGLDGVDTGEIRVVEREGRGAAVRAEMLA